MPFRSVFVRAKATVYVIHRTISLMLQELLEPKPCYANADAVRAGLRRPECRGEEEKIEECSVESLTSVCGLYRVWWDRVGLVLKGGATRRLLGC